MMCGSPAVRICPNAPLLSDVSGGFEIHVVDHVEHFPPELQLQRPAALNVRVTAKSLSNTDGFTIVNGFSVLYVPDAGDAKAARLMYGRRSPVAVRIVEDLDGSLSPEAVRALSTPRVTVDGCPLNRTMGDNSSR